MYIWNKFRSITTYQYFNKIVIVYMYVSTLKKESMKNAIGIGGVTLFKQYGMATMAF